MSQVDLVVVKDIFGTFKYIKCILFHTIYSKNESLFNTTTNIP